MSGRSIKDSLKDLKELENNMAMTTESADDFIVMSDEELEKLYPGRNKQVKTRPINTMINVVFKEGEEDLAEMQAIYNSIGFEAIFMTHYQLSAGNKFTPIQWKTFLTDPRVNQFINEELEMLKHQKIAKMLREVDDNRSVGQAQLLNTLLNQTKKENKKDGPVFVYCWVPLNENEQHAENVEVQDVSLTKYFENQERPDTI